MTRRDVDVISATGTLICSSTFDIRLADRSIFDSHAYSPLLGSKCGFRRGFWHGIELPRLKTFRVFGPSSIYFCCLVCCLPLLGFVRCHQRMTAGGHSLPPSLPSIGLAKSQSVCQSMLLLVGLLLLLLRRPALIKHWSVDGGTACLPTIFLVVRHSTYRLATSKDALGLGMLRP